jgi:hypothetical protein
MRLPVKMPLVAKATLVKDTKSPTCISERYARRAWVSSLW